MKLAVALCALLVSSVAFAAGPRKNLMDFSTAHLMDDGQSFFNWPPHPMTFTKTMAEAMRLSKTGCDLNVFMLDHDPGSAEFVEGMVRRAGGRVFYPDLDDLGSVVVHDFLRNRQG